MKKNIVLKLLGLSVLTMIVLMAISFLEVAVYAYLVNPGLAEEAYEAHAQSSAPYISGIFGFIIFFLVARYWKRKNYVNAFRLAILFPLIYMALDVVILVSFGIDWSEFILIFILANGAKFLGSFLGYKLTKVLQATL